MKFRLIFSKKNVASMSMFKELKKRDLKDIEEFISIEVFNDCMVKHDLDVKEDYIIFLSTHTSASKKPCLTVHSIGNWGKAELGGKDNTLIKTSPELIQTLLQNQNEEFNNNPIPEWEVTMEATHHGPTTNKPTAFLEIGSSENEWNNETAAKININALIKTIKMFNQKSITSKLINNKDSTKRFIFLGNTHYPRKATELILNWKLIGHICPKYNLHNLNKNLLEQALDKSNAKKVIIDKKGMGKEKRRIIELLDELKIEYEKV